jgi:hypothetical protein
MALRIRITTNPIKFSQAFREKTRPIATAAVAALREVSEDAVEEGRDDIGRAGPGFTHAKWQSGYKYRIKGATKNGVPSMEAISFFSHRYGIASVFQEGAKIEGHPLMWIPTSKNVARLGGSHRKTMRSDKKLTFATVRGVPLAFDADDHNRNRKPLYIGVPRVVIPKKFHLNEIIEQNAEKIGEAFLREFKDSD